MNGPSNFSEASPDMFVISREFVMRLIDNPEFVSNLRRIAVQLALDPGLTYSRFMAMSVAYWMTGKLPTIDDGDQPKYLNDSERVFNLMWLAYEQWIFRGWSHYAEVAGHLGIFYRGIRWNLVPKRYEPGEVKHIDAYIASTAQEYFIEIIKLAKTNYDEFDGELQIILGKLQEIIDEKTDRQPDDSS